MTSILKADTIQDTDGNNIINESGNTITIGASGDTITIPSGATITNSGTATGFGEDNTPAFSAYMGSTQTLSDNVDTKVNFDTEDFDTDSAYDTSNKRFTVPSGEGGKYFFYHRGRFYQSDHNSQYVIAIRVNGAEVAKRYLYSGGTGTKAYHSATYMSYDLSATEVLSAGDYVEAYVKADNVAGNNIDYQNGTIQSEFSGFKLGGV